MDFEAKNYLNFAGSAFSLCVITACVLVFSVRVTACSCSNRSTAATAYEKAQNVAILRVLTVERPAAVPKSENKSPEKKKSVRDLIAVFGQKIEVAKLVVEKVYKGDLKVGQELTYVQLSNSCSHGFGEGAVGRRILDYLGEYKTDKEYGLNSCMRDTQVGPENPDIRFLENIEKSRNKTRLSGFVSQIVDSPLLGVEADYIRQSGHRVKIFGEGIERDLVTDRYGVFEVYDLEPGLYEIIPEGMEGYKDRISSNPLGSISLASLTSANKRNRLRVEVANKSHAELRIYYGIDNRIRGIFTDASGKPMNNVCLDLKPTIGERKRYFSGSSDCTNDKGLFEFNKIPEGNYLIEVNDDDKITARMPFGRFYYPGVKDRAEAAVLSVAPGVFFDDLSLSPPETAEFVEVSGTLMFSDDRPVRGRDLNASVVFLPEDLQSDSNGNRQRSSGTRVGTDGTFKMRILKGRKGVLQVSIYSRKGKFESCPEHDKLLDHPKRRLEVLAQDYQIDTGQSLSNIILKMPMPFCKKKVYK